MSTNTESSLEILKRSLVIFCGRMLTPFTISTVNQGNSSIQDGTALECAKLFQGDAGPGPAPGREGAGEPDGRASLVRVPAAAEEVGPSQ